MTDIKKDFPWFKANPKITYLDSAATSLKPQKVIDSINDFYINYGTNSHNLDSSFSYKTYDKISEYRSTIASIFNCEASNIAFCSGATESLSLIANALKEKLNSKDEILLNNAEHGSNIVPWLVAQKIKKFKINFINDDTLITAESILKAINKKTKLISFALVSNLFGNIIDYKKIVIEARKVNPEIIIVIDATQAMPHMKIDTKNYHIDFISCSAHKMLGPTGIGCTYINSKWIDNIEPIRFGGGMNSILTQSNFTYAKGIDRFEGGTLNMSGIFGWAAAIQYLNNYGWDNIMKHEVELKKYMVNNLLKIKNIKIYNIEEPLAIVLLNYDGVFAQDLAGYLGKNNIITRAGLSCAKLSNCILKTPAVIRISCYIYNTKEDIDVLIKQLKKFKKGDEIQAIL